MAGAKIQHFSYSTKFFSNFFCKNMQLFSFFLKKGQLPKKLPFYTLLYIAIEFFSNRNVFAITP